MAHFSVLGIALALLPINAAYSSGGCWKTLEPIPVAPRQEHSVVGLSDSKLAILGGITSSVADFNTTSLFQIYDIPSNTWTTAADAPVRVNHPNVAAVDGKVYLLGGLSPSTDGAWTAFPESWMYDPITNVWKEISPMPPGQARGSATMGVNGKKIYLAGGVTKLVPAIDGEQDTVGFVTAFDTESLSWYTLPSAAKDLPNGRDHAGGSVFDDKFYVIGGRENGQHNLKDTVFVLDLNNLEGGWCTKDKRMPTARAGIVTGTVNGKVYVFGGEGNPAAGSNGVFNQTEVFDTKKESWEQLAPMHLPRHGGGAVAIGSGIYVPGGGLQEGGRPDSTLDVFQPTDSFL
ncbi:uncharacterized protein LY79DRAFT_584846 [Colletotrichum navitas]|uniref:Kelch repeat-containing protein n=1 Tax=Colletotrichum navitas TaxID=681940 RepID=A0AAD8UW63_9PEZI|nr:uncharacterized protein LY79DRAFT_584846 [Colletotrichum navitas]KAK1566372.1 hypothetical protein LY79DRAFT_584846 [Colletotrichum navitas]